MDWGLTLTLMLGGLAVLLLIGLPVAFAFIAVTTVGAYFVLGGDRGILQLARNSAQSVANFQLAPIPLFIQCRGRVALFPTVWVLVCPYRQFG